MPLMDSVVKTDRVLLINAAREAGLENIERLEDLFLEGMKNSYKVILESPTSQTPIPDEHLQKFRDISLEYAVKIATVYENGGIGYRYARAFMEGNVDELEKLRIKITGLPGERHEDIHRQTVEYAKSFALNTHLPTLEVTLNSDHTITHPAISADDKTLFHRLFNERQPRVDALIESNHEKAKEWDMRKAQTPRKNEENSIAEIFEETTNQEDNYLLDTFKDMDIFKRDVTDAWDLENNQYSFSSITETEERRNYDHTRDHARWKKEKTEQRTPEHS